MVYCGLTGETVPLPLDSAKYEGLLKQLISDSKLDLHEVVPVSHPLVAELVVVEAESG